jgi:hypothetical protein
LIYDVKNLKIEKLLYMVYQPRYSYGFINSEGKINFDKNLNGKISALIKGQTDKKVLYKEFNFTNAAISYNVNSNIDIKNSIAFIKTDINSDVANAVLPDGNYYIDKNKFTGSYKVNIPDLNKLYFAIQKHLKGKITVNGKIKKDKNLLVTGYSKTLRGEITYKLFNNIFTLKAKDLNFIEVMDMMMYPKIFDSIANAILEYNITTKKGKLDAYLLDGHFLPNKLSSLINTLAHFDLTKEIYKKAVIHSDIDDKKIISDLYMNSKLTHITSKKALIDLEKEYVNAKLKIFIIKRPLIVRIKGNLYSPYIKLDAKEFFKSKVKDKSKKKLKEVEKKIKEKINKKINIKDIFHF